MNNGGICHQNTHVAPAVDTVDLIELEDHVPALHTLSRSIWISLIVELREHKRPPGVRMERTLMGPFQPSRKLGRYQHETLEQHKQAVNTGEKSDANDEVRYQVTDQLG